jgi:solute:Na+ symporter, SSS family
LNSAIYIAIVIVYVLVMLGVGYWSMKRTQNVGDFFLGGRTLGPWMSAFAFGTTYFSAVLFIGYAGQFGWKFGIHTMWIVLGNTLIGSILSWKILAGRTRDMTARLNAITMPEFLRARFNSKPLQIIGALVVFMFLVPYSASVYMGLSYLFEGVFNIRYEYALAFLAGLTGVYLVMGGYFAVAVSDFLRGIVEFAGVLLMVFLLAHWKGGFGQTSMQLIENPAQNAPGLAKIVSLGPPGMQFAVPGVVLLIALVVITSFGPWSLPQMVQKFYSIRSKFDVKRAMIIAGAFSLFMAFGAYFSGALTHIYYPSGPPQAIMELSRITGNMEPNLDKLMPTFIIGNVPHWLVLIILLLVFSASMSSLSSLVLVSSSAIVVDFIGSFVDRDANQKRTLGLLRFFCAIFVGISLFIALKKIDVIANLMMISWGSLAGVFLAPYFYGLFWKRTTVAGVYAGIITGLISSFGLLFLWGKPGVPLAGAITMLLPMIVVPIVSIFTKPPPQELIDRSFNDPQPEQSSGEWKSEATI